MRVNKKDKLLLITSFTVQVVSKEDILDFEGACDRQRGSDRRRWRSSGVRVGIAAGRDAAF